MNKLRRVFHYSLRLCLLFFIVGNCYAKMYKWVDEDGNTHYSEKPPAGDVEVQTVKPPPKVNTEKALKQQEENKKKSEEAKEEQTKSAEEKTKDEADKARQKANCETARKNLASVSANPRVYSVGADGERRRLGEEERQAKITAAQKDIAEFCK